MATTCSLRVAVLLVLVIAGIPVASASFIGNDVQVQHLFPDASTAFDATSTTVAADSSDRVMMTAFADRRDTYGVDVSANAIVIDFVETTNFSSGFSRSYHGVYVGGLLGTPGQALADAEVTRNGGLWLVGPSRLTFGADWVSLDWLGLIVNDGETFEITLTESESSVPLPASLSLLIPGLLGVARGRRPFKMGSVPIFRVLLNGVCDCRDSHAKARMSIAPAAAASPAQVVTSAPV